MNPGFAKMFRIYLILFGLYAIAIGAYIWFDAAQPTAAADRGTAVDPATFMPGADLAKMKEYSALRNWLFFISYPWEWGIYLFLLFSGAAASWSKRFVFPVFIFVLTVAVFALQLPLRIAGYSISRSYGISTQSAASWMQDMAVSFGIRYLMLLAIVWVVYFAMGRVRRWWLALWLLSVPFIVFMTYVQPVVIDPLYNTFKPLSDPELERHILELADRAGIPADRVYEVNISEKTNALNAYVTGIGPSLRIVIWDTTLEALNEREILFIMAHEIGHYVMHHLEWSVAGSAGSALLFLWIGSRLYRYSVVRWGGFAGIRKENDRASLPLLLLILSVLTFLTLPASNAVSREAERAADRYAVELTGSGKGAVGMYHKLAASSLSDIDPPLLVKWFRSTHPSIKERILFVQSVEARK
ncbi:M48 family metallopeptidase [Paenibacillus alkalitolerans]|uniref:M48 family metallopeptidase n=1 Tax=Paenibacillus alkalitolerans TaxID=2799335 RepID=UPI0018F40DD5|nr:M48 family metallopeptidase [Paenibacillus alkalitolerans]